MELIPPGGSSVSDDDGSSGDSDTDITAGMRLILMDQAQPPITFFNGQAALMSVLWSLNGDPITAFEGQFLASTLRGVIPLASGQRANIDFSSGVWIKMTGAAEASLWYGNAHTTIATQ